jgi:hypothetical protein
MKRDDILMNLLYEKIMVNEGIFDTAKQKIKGFVSKFKNKPVQPVEDEDKELPVAQSNPVPAEELPADNTPVANDQPTQDSLSKSFQSDSSKFKPNFKKVRNSNDERWYKVPFEFLENNPKEVSHDYISIPDLYELLDLTDNEFAAMKKRGLIGVVRIKGTPYVPVSQIEGKKNSNRITDTIEAVRIKGLQSKTDKVEKKPVTKKKTTKKVLKKK